MAESQGTILVVEDEQLTRKLLERALSRQGYRVLVATDGEQAIEVYRCNKLEIDVVLLDLGLPKIAGWEVFLKMKEENSDVKVVVASGYIDPELRSEMFHAGIKHIVPKPYMLDELVEKLRNAMTEQ